MPSSGQVDVKPSSVRLIDDTKYFYSSTYSTFDFSEGNLRYQHLGIVDLSQFSRIVVSNYMTLKTSSNPRFYLIRANEIDGRWVVFGDSDLSSAGVTVDHGGDPAVYFLNILAEQKYVTSYNESPISAQRVEPIIGALGNYTRAASVMTSKKQVNLLERTSLFFFAEHNSAAHQFAGDLRIEGFY